MNEEVLEQRLKAIERDQKEHCDLLHGDGSEAMPGLIKDVFWLKQQAIDARDRRAIYWGPWVAGAVAALFGAIAQAMVAAAGK